MEHLNTTTPERSIDIRRFIQWRTVLGLIVAGLALWILARNVQWADIVSVLQRADYRWVLFGVVAILGTFFTRTRRWQALLWQSTPRFRPTLTALLVGQVVNLVLPMRSGDAARAVWIRPETGTGATEALASVAIEKMWDLLALVVTGALVLVWFPLPAWFAQSTWGTAILLAVGLLVLFVGLRWRETLLRISASLLAYLPAQWDEAVLLRLNRFADGLESIRRPDTSSAALAWTVLTWVLGAVANFAVLAAFNIPSVIAAFFLLAALMVSGAVPIPGRLGIFEGTTVVSLALFGIPNELALTVGVILHLVVMGPPLLATAVLVFWPAQTTEDTDATA